MKTVIAFNYYVSSMLKDSGYDAAKVLKSVQDFCNDKANRTETEQPSKRGKFSGGKSWNKEGELTIKDLNVKEMTPTEYTFKPGQPGEFLKWNDALETLFKKCGKPFGAITTAFCPDHLVFWLESKFKVESKPEVEEGKQSNSKGNRQLAVVEQINPPRSAVVGAVES